MSSEGTWRAAITRTIPAPAEPLEAGSFERYAALVTLRHGVMMCVAFGLGALLLWPTDRLLFPARPEVRQAFGVWRLELIGLAVAAVALAPTGRRWPSLVIIGGVGSFALLLAASAGRALAAAGGPDEAWFHTLYVVPLAVFPLSVSLVPRLLLTALATGGCMAGYFLSQPRYLQAPELPTIAVALVGTTLVAILIGHSHFRLLRTAFEQRVQLAVRAHALEQRVAERTASLRRLTDHLERSREQERQRMGRDLHDELAQLLTAMRLELRLAQRAAPEQLQPLSRLDAIVDQMFEAKERLVRALQPAELDALGLAGAVRVWVAEVDERSDVELALALEVEPPEPPADTAIAAFRMLQEGVTNAIRHADATRIDVELVCRGGVLRLVITDDGVGFDPRAVSDGHFGLLGVRERVEALGGEMVLDSAPGKGTRFALSLRVTGSAPRMQAPPDPR
ncbi:sensor histidine kinase [Paraliomyxa miuraensis]|uniref:sensor histidine kinase n=1 Tax=Paraliomyxa miuraensis TaxID=376150 RepID=UPI00224D5FBE|nr:sensor histidine kinase [Paraliomyxa miuraensis]MCX4245194.1 sensor histidine kinase [Paraliomyxa miuraensis]